MTTPSTVYLVRLKNGRQEQVSWNSWLFVCRVGLPESFSRILEPRNYPSELKAEEARLCASRLRDYLGKCKLMEEEVGELCLPFDPEFIKIIQAQPLFLVGLCLNDLDEFGVERETQFADFFFH